jgi:hypothetical protein
MLPDPDPPPRRLLSLLPAPVRTGVLPAVKGRPAAVWPGVLPAVGRPAVCPGVLPAVGRPAVCPGVLPAGSGTAKAVELTSFASAEGGAEETSSSALKFFLDLGTGAAADAPPRSTPLISS